MTTPFELIDSLLNEMIEQQKQKVMRLAVSRHPGLTPEDVRNAQDFPELEADSLFNFEDGLLSGLLAAQTAVRSRRHLLGER